MTPAPKDVAEKLLAMELPRRWLHVQGVGRRAASIALLFDDPHERWLLKSSAVLHDIGYSPMIASTELHALDGAIYLRDIGFPQRLCALVAHHSCAQFEAELRGLAEDLSCWQDERTPVRDALWWADMTTTPDGKVTDVHARIHEIEERYGDEDVVTVFIRRARRELVAAVERTEERLRMAGLSHLAK
ncbi:HD domain-containing protein [Saccharothrix yanglingensis]|uniref:Phosphohydrolase n=1 Tax=Saccharothrix yanglingensis TaxID=659496 RepID=A0ABU0X1L7_9PSEU|nr:HD domain-containing protein [Saccharothrix yanglingensis]MDQ2586016.1 phosphohydrolase [Saccharothrix yanglingensis]